jgi:CRISPR/Cas system-associated protein Csx1
MNYWETLAGIRGRLVDNLESQGLSKDKIIDLSNQIIASTERQNEILQARIEDLETMNGKRERIIEILETQKEASDKYIEALEGK